MTASTLLLLAAYGVAVAGILVLVRAYRPTALARQHRVTVVAAVLATGIIAAAVVWRVPVAAQQRVDAASSLSPVPTLPQVSCDVLLRTLGEVARMSNDELSISSGGEIITDQAVWRRFPDEYRRMLIDLASRAAKCTDPGLASPEVVVRSKGAGTIYERNPAPR